MSTGTPEKPSRKILVGELGDSAEAQIDWFRHMRANQPVRYRPEIDTWDVFRYEDVLRVLRDVDTFAVTSKPQPGLPFSFGRSSPDEHRALKALLAKDFVPTGHRVRTLLPGLTQEVDALLDEAAEAGGVDVVAGLGYPIMEYATLRLFGVKIEGSRRFRTWSEQLFGELMGACTADHDSIYEYFTAMLHERRRRRRGDVMSALINAQEAGADVTDRTIIHMCVDLLTAGNAPTSVLLAYAVARCCRQPDLHRQLRAAPGRIPGAVEECLRYDFSWVNLWRTARRDVLVGGQEVRAGQYVAAWTSSANFDESIFPDPDTFDIGRTPNRHLTFGAGMYRCLAHPLVAVVATTVLERLTARFPRLRLHDERPPRLMEGTKGFVLSLDVTV